MRWYRAGGSGGEARNEDGGKVGLPALEVALAFPQATPASLFPPAGEIPRPVSLILFVDHFFGFNCRFWLYLVVRWFYN